MQNAIRPEAAWAVRGIPEDVRRQVVDRAKAEGRTVGAWVSEALRRALDGDSLEIQIEDLRQRVEKLERSA